MAANDYHVVVYQILSYLYDCLKGGNDVNLAALDKLKDDAGVNEKYWAYILKHLVQNGFVEGVAEVAILGAHDKGLKCTEAFAITPAGIEYLTTNSLMAKTKEALTAGLKAAAPALISKFF